MSVVITTYTLASGLMQQGMTWWQAMLTILLGNIDRAGADDPERARRHEVRRLVPGAVPRELRRAAARTCRRCCARSSPAAGSASRPGSAALALNTLLARGVARLGRRAGQRRGSRSRSSGRSRSRSSSSGLEGIKKLESWSAPLLLAGGALLLGWAISRGGGSGHILDRVRAAADGARAVLAAVSGGAHRERRLLGDAQPQHPRLHPLRAQPALAGARPGARPADDDDRVRVHRRRGHERDDRDLRRGDLGSGRADRAHRQPAGDHLRRAGRARSRSSRPTWRPTSSRRRTTSRTSSPRRISYVTGGLITAVIGIADDAVEALRRRGGVHLHLAGRLLEPDGRDRRHPDRRLLGRAPAASCRCPICSSSNGATRTRRRQLARDRSRWCSRSCRSCPASCAPRRRRAGRSRIRRFFDTLYTYAWFVTFALSFVLYLVLRPRDVG